MAQEDLARIVTQLSQSLSQSAEIDPLKVDIFLSNPPLRWIRRGVIAPTTG